MYRRIIRPAPGIPRPGRVAYCKVPDWLRRNDLAVSILRLAVTVGHPKFHDPLAFGIASDPAHTCRRINLDGNIGCRRGAGTIAYNRRTLSHRVRVG